MCVKEGVTKWVTERMAEQMPGRAEDWLTEWPTEWLVGWRSDWTTKRAASKLSKWVNMWLTFSRSLLKQDAKLSVFQWGKSKNVQEKKDSTFQTTFKATYKVATATEIARILCVREEKRKRKGRGGCREGDQAGKDKMARTSWFTKAKKKKGWWGWG